MRPLARLAFDIGGTFTDLVLDDGATLHRGKVLTTPDAPEHGALTGLDELLRGVGVGWPEVSEVVHGTTLVTNAILERRFTATGLLTTKGFRDVLAMGRQQRYDAYDLRIGFPEPLVPRELRLEVAERTLASGRVVVAADAAEVTRAAGRLVEAGVRAVAICFLHAYRAPDNERVAADAVRTAYPELIVVASSEVAPEIREYERTVTTVATAAVLPLVDGYLDALVEGLAGRGCGGPLRLMQSSARTAPESAVRSAPISLLESGPAGGARAGARAGAGRVLCFDMGGTTAKACLTDTDGELPVVGELEVARVHRFKAGSGLPLRVASIDLVEIGAGGGSIASTDRLGLLRVGPESAGADPGPACYGFGGSQPTVTDANLYLGYLGPRTRLAGSMALDPQAAEKALGRLGQRLGLGVPALALGIHRLVNEQMAAAARGHVIDRGGDPRRVTLVVTGGAGPAHAAEVARLLGCPRVVVPVGAGTASAAGFLGAPAGVERSRSLPRVLDRVDWAEVRRLYTELEREVREVADTPGGTELCYEHRVDARLVGQVHALTVPLRRFHASVAADIRAAYQQRFRVDPGELPIEILTWRCQGTGPPPVVSEARPTAGSPASGSSPHSPAGLEERSTRGRFDSGASRAVETSRQVRFDGEHPVRCRVLRRGELRRGQVLRGPIVITEVETTTVVPPGDRLEVGATGELVIVIGGAG